MVEEKSKHNMNSYVTSFNSVARWSNKHQVIILVKNMSSFSITFKQIYLATNLFYSFINCNSKEIFNDFFRFHHKIFEIKLTASKLNFDWPFEIQLIPSFKREKSINFIANNPIHFIDWINKNIVYLVWFFFSYMSKWQQKPLANTLDRYYNSN